jgi:hypothetical protein
MVGAFEFYSFAVMTCAALVFLATRCDKLRNRIDQLEKQ